MPSNRLLIIDDEPNVAATIGKVARRCGYDTIITTESEDFLGRAHSWRPTVIVLDLSIPGMDGCELLVQLGKEACDAQILIISGHSRSEMEAAQRLGRMHGLTMAGTLQKPLRVDALRIVFETINNTAGIITRVDIQDALENNQFYVAYQPQINLQSMQMVGVEALARWIHPARGPVPPTTFIPLLEESGLIDEFTHKVVDITIPQLRLWRESGLELKLAINVSAKNFGSGNFDTYIDSRCAKYGIASDYITLELTESAAMERVGDSASLKRLAASGVSLSIDDFGTGYSSLVQLHRLPFSEIKIDRSFVLECMSDKECSVFVRAIIDLAHNLNMTSVAEGIESIEVMNHLANLGCDLAQGYAISRPLIAKELYQWALTWGATNQHMTAY